MASLETVYGHPAALDIGGENMNPLAGFNSDSTPTAVALMLLFWGGVLYLLKKYGFRFNFGVAGGR